MYKLPRDLKSKYEFVTLAAKRAEQLQMGAPAKVESIERKATVVAQEEVATGLVGPWSPEEDAVPEEAVVEEE